MATGVRRFFGCDGELLLKIPLRGCGRRSAWTVVFPRATGISYLKLLFGGPELAWQPSTHKHTRQNGDCRQGGQDGDAPAGQALGGQRLQRLPCLRAHGVHEGALAVAHVRLRGAAAGERGMLTPPRFNPATLPC